MRAISLVVPAADAELAADRLWAAGARAVEELDAADGRLELRTTLGSDDDLSLERLGPIPAIWMVSFADLADEPAATWREFASPVHVSDRLVIHPAWQPVDVVADVLSITIEPADSFGLGDHPTTRLSAASVDDLIRPGDRVLDVGCGSGVLSILAARRGAAAVTAIDVSEAAREATIANASANEVADLVAASTTPVHEIAGTFDLVVANILAPALVAMAGELCRLVAPGGALVISGVLTGSYDHVVGALAPLIVVRERHADGWSALELRFE